MTMPTAAWLAWAAASIVVAVSVALAVGALAPELEGNLLVFAAGMAWSALTPLVLRWASRRAWVRG